MCVVVLHVQNLNCRVLLAVGGMLTDILLCFEMKFVNFLYFGLPVGSEHRNVSSHAVHSQKCSAHLPTCSELGNLILSLEI